MTQGTGFTSYSAPMVTGIIADVHEGNPSVKHWPGVVMAGLMATADENTDENLGNAWPLSLHDAVDDSDGAGLANGFWAAFALAGNAKRNGGDPAASLGHDFGHIYPTTTPAQSFYSETWNASVASGARLRATSVLLTAPTCPNPLSWDTCTGTTYPLYFLAIYDSVGTLVSLSMNTNNNYQVVNVLNSSGQTANYTLRIYLANWSGLNIVEYGLAWTSL